MGVPEHITLGPPVSTGGYPSDLNRNYGWDLPDNEATTIAGLIIHESQTIPRANNAYIFYGFKFKILERKRNQITSIRIEKV